jgi:hypothetical protein
MTPWPCWRCGAVGSRNVGSHGYCGTHLAELFRTFDPGVWAMNGVGLPVGRLRPEFGPCMEDLECIACGAGWSGVAGDRCEWCRSAREAVTAHQRELVLRVPDVGDHEHADEVLYAWGQRLETAVAAGVVSRDEAARAWRRAVTRAA